MGIPQWRSVYVVRAYGEIGHVYSLGLAGSEVHFDDNHVEFVPVDDIEITEEIIILEEQ